LGYHAMKRADLLQSTKKLISLYSQRSSVMHCFESQEQDASCTCTGEERPTAGMFKCAQGQQEGLQLVLGQEQVLACPCRLPYPFQGLPATHGMLLIAKQDWHTRHVCVLKLM